MKRNYLHDCFEAFEEGSKEKYGTAQDLAAIEFAVAPLRNRRALTYKDLKDFESPRNWEFKTWWVFPPEQHLTPELQSREFNFQNLPDDEESVIAALLQVFKSIELVSIILRFVRPEQYGIISPPVERILDVRRESDAVKTYLNYIDDLREVAKRYRFERVANADMALWVLHERCFGNAPDEGTRTAYANDPFIRKLRAQNLMRRFLAEFTYAQRAHSLLSTDYFVAGQFGGIAFEQMVRRRVPQGRNWDDVDLGVLIDRLRREEIIDIVTHRRWDEARITRNMAIHLNPRLERKKVQELIELLDLSAPDPAPPNR